MSAVFDPLGGQTVTWGKGRLEMGWVEIEVEMGEDAQSLYELRIKRPAHRKLAATTNIQRHLPILDFDLET